ncbi:MPBQ/MSBQ transferase [Tribonema minus]|uniref:MPBQ/MSBQ transferase n=1 Tax=Tribonema minus TaxID=303371 RepID=A0A835ZA13_9STRA|nr:MPBQ/MSBQ transferase [Tribonema minus]
MLHAHRAVAACLLLLASAQAFVPLSPARTQLAAAAPPAASRAFTSSNQHAVAERDAQGTVSMASRSAALAFSLPAALTSSFTRRAAIAVAATTAVVLVVKALLDKPSRPYDREANTVGNEYDAWCEDGILEQVWGEHIHLGYYDTDERKRGSFRKDIIQAKYDFIDKMMQWGGVNDMIRSGHAPKKVLDVGCGIGGTSRYLATKLGEGSEVVGITLSPKQVERATQLARDRKIGNARFTVMDALAMEFPDDSFDLVWACESGEHMPDKRLYVEEMTRVLKPGGRIVIATWCQRDDHERPFTPREERKLDFLYSEWTHPHFISIQDYAKLMDGTGQLDNISTADWTVQTIASWRHTIWMGIKCPWIWIPRCGLRWALWWKTFKDAWCLERMSQAFSAGLMEYGMMKAIKRKPKEAREAPAPAETAPRERDPPAFNPGPGPIQQ